MPYNLRKRKAPEPVEEPKTIKVRKTKKKPATVSLEVEEKIETESKPVKEVDTKKETKKETKAEKKSRKPDTEVETKVEKKSKKTETKVETKAETKVETKAEIKTQAKSQAKVEAKSEQIVEAGNLYVFGEDSCGEFGLGKIGVVKNKPTMVPLNFRMKQIACGPMHTVALTTDGEVYTFGCNDEGALGRITEEEKEEATPTLIQLDDKIIKVTAGDSHSAALSENNKVYIWGNFKDEHGSVGLLPECNGEKSYKPIQVMPDVELKDIASGSNHMLLLDSEGKVYSFGVGAQGQLGRLSAEEMGFSENEPESITAKNRDLFLKPQPISFKGVDPQRTFVCDAIYAGNYTSFATNTDKKKNRLAGWGLNNYHQLGYKGTKQQLKQHFPKRSTFTCSTSMVNVACGAHHTIFLTKTGRVFAAGKPLYGMLGLGKVTGESVCPAKNVEGFDDSVMDIATNSSASFAVTADGKLYSWGMSGPYLGTDLEEDLMEPAEVKRLEGKKVTSISSGSTFTAVLVE